MNAADEDDTSVKEKEDDAVDDNKDTSAAEAVYRLLAEDEDDATIDEDDSFVEDDKNNTVDDINKTPSNPTTMSTIQKKITTGEDEDDTLVKKNKGDTVNDTKTQVQQMKTTGFKQEIKMIQLMKPKKLP